MNSEWQNIDKHLQGTFGSWGDTPPPRAWHNIAGSLDQRMTDKRRSRRNILLAFFSGIVMAALVTGTVVMHMNDTGNTTVANNKSNGPGIKQLAAETAATDNSIPPMARTTANRPYAIKERSAETMLKNTEPVYTTAVLSDHVSVVKTTAGGISVQGEQLFSGFEIMRFKTLPVHIALPDRNSVPQHVHLGLPKHKRFPLYFGLALGYSSDAAKVSGYSDNGAAHRDAREEYKRWLRSPSRGISVTAELNAGIGSGWQIQGNVNYTYARQHINYNYTMRDIPVVWNGTIAGYLTLPDSQARVYGDSLAGNSSSMRITLAIGKQVLNFKRWALSIYAYASPQIAGKQNSSLLNLNTGNFENTANHIRSSRIPLGYALRASYRLAGGMQLFVQGGQSFNTQHINISGAQMKAVNTSSKFSIGIQYPLNGKKIYIPTLLNKAI